VKESEEALVERTCRDSFGLPLGGDALSRIERFVDLLVLWNQRLRLTGERDRSGLIRKHVIDSLACAPLLPLEGQILDIGTGAGFPGAVLGCVRPDLGLTLLDARQRPVSFLGEVIRHLPLPRARALAMRAEDAAEDPTLAGLQSVVTCRALRIDVFLPLAKPLLGPGGFAVSMQTPRLDSSAVAEIARKHGLDLVELREYRLPDGERRRLVVAR
jgi:16S rRNA (guanine527-N7)-methyltransferase